MRIRQIVFAVRELAPASAALARLFALDPPFADPGVAEFGLHNAVYVFGDQFVEIVSPVRAGTTAGRLLDRRGDSGYMLILQTDELGRERARFAQLGVRTVFEVDYPDISAVHLHPKDIGGAIVSVDEPRPAASWRWAGPHWRMQDGRSGAQRVRGLTLEAVDPPAMARRWAQLLGLAVPAERGPAWRLPLQDGWVDFVAESGRGEGIAGYTLAVAEREAVLKAARDLDLPVDGTDVTLFGTRLSLISL